MVQWMEAHAGLAGWIQAIGALITLWVAIALPMHQRRLAQRESEAALAGKIDRAALNAAQVFQSLLSLRNPSPFPEGPTFRRDLLSGIERLPHEVIGFPAQTVRLRAIQPLSAFSHSLLEFSNAASSAARGAEFEGDLAPEIAWLTCQATLGGTLEALGRLKRAVPRMACHWGEVALRDAAKKSQVASDIAGIGGTPA